MTLNRTSESSSVTKIAALLFSLQLLLACAAPTKIDTSVVLPARFHEATTIRDIAVLPFAGPDGAAFTAEIEEVLATVRIDERPYFKLVDRTNLDKILSEMKLSMSGMFDQETAGKVGKMVGAKGIYTGVVTVSSVVDSPYTENRSRCVSYDTLYYTIKNTRIPVQVCTAWQNYPVGCTKRVAIFSFVPKLIDVETGRILYSNSISHTVSDSACTDKRPVADSLTLLNNAKAAVKNEFRSDVAPYKTNVTLELADSTDDISTYEAKKKFKSGLSFARGNRMDRACEFWKDASALSPKSFSILYNLGICAELYGQLEQALETFNKADRLLEKPDKRVSEAISRVSSSIEKQRRLQQQR